MLALYRYLKSKGKKVTATLGEDIIIPPQYQFLPGQKEISKITEDLEDSVFIALDCANLDRLGAIKTAACGSKALINIDHHPDNSRFGSINVLDSKASSVAEMVYSILKYIGADIDEEMATCLYVGIVTDTGRFQYSNTTSRALKVASELVEYGANPNRIFQNVYENNSFAWLKIVGRGIDKAVFMPELTFVYTAITFDDFLQTGASLGETENLVDWLRGLQGVHISAVLKETKDKKVKVSLRSRGKFNVSAIANSFGGGGHKNAAGYVSELELDKVIKSLVATVTEACAAMQPSE